MTSALTYEIVNRVSSLADRDVEELPPLQKSIDLDALESLTEYPGTLIQFTYDKFTVTVETRRDGDALVTVEPTVLGDAENDDSGKSA